MRRIGLGVVVVLLAVVLTACPPPPQGYSPPKIESVQVSPEPVQPGGTLTMVIEAIDDRGITNGFGRSLITPTGTTLSVLGTCTDETAPNGDFQHVLITITCPIPEFASNGTWRLEIRINDGGPLENLPGLTTRLPFEVAGGTDDRIPPRLVHYEISPTTVDQETPFTLTVRLRDESGVRIGQAHQGSSFVFVKPFAPQSMFSCSNPGYTQVSATDVDVVMTCYPSNFSIGGRSEAGIHRAFMPVHDALMQQGNIEMSVDVLPAP